jgi:hypothetical protein
MGMFDDAVEAEAASCYWCERRLVVRETPQGVFYGCINCDRPFGQTIPSGTKSKNQPHQD